MQAPSRLLTIALLLWGTALNVPLLAVTAAPSMPSPGPSAVTPQTVLQRLFTAPAIEPNWFTPSFVAAVPVTQVQALVEQLKTRLGAYQRVELDGANYRVVFERGTVPTQIQLNKVGQITGLFFQPPVLKYGSLAELLQAFRALPGQVHVLVQQNNREIVSLNPKQPLAVGSAFKLVVLQALRQQIAAGKHRWEEVIRLRSQWRNLSSPTLQNWPEAAPLTVHTLATLMMAQSDNTATDALMDVVGRDAIAALAPRNQPFLTVREAFVLKSQPHQALLQRYRQAPLAERQAILEREVALAPAPKVEDFGSEPRAIADVEWFFTPQELCHHMAAVQDLPLMSVNPGLANSNDWKRVAYKGGSEPGVLNLTTWVEATNGDRYCVVATWNHTQPLQESEFYSLYISLLNQLTMPVRSR